MSLWMTVLVSGSLLFLIIIDVAQALRSRNWRLLAIQIVVVTLFSLFLNALFGFPASKRTVAKSPSSDLAVGLALFLCMILGMLGQFLYNHFAAPASQRKNFDWGLFLAPLFASPVVFVPLLAAFQNANIDLSQLTTPRLMVFLVTFENGFFWKDFFDKQRREVVQ